MGVLDAPQAPLVPFQRVRRRQLVPVATRTSPSFALSPNLSTAASNLGGTSRSGHFATVTCHGLVVGYSNFYNSTGTETAAPNSGVTLTASIELVNGRKFPLTFGGLLSIVIPPGGTVFSDPMGGNVAKGTWFWCNQRVVVASGEQFPLGGYTTNQQGSGGEGHNYALTPGADLTGIGSGNPSTVGGTRMFAPSVILGLPGTPVDNALAIVGDSIAAGSGDSGAHTDDGWVQRALAGNYAYLQLAYPSETTDGWFQQSGNTCFRRQSLMERAGVTKVLHELGVNSLTNGALQAHTLANWIKLALYGDVWQTTITPQTTSTDGWGTTGNQTVISGSNETARVAFNTWLRDGAPIQAGAPVAPGTSGGTVYRIGSVNHPLAGYLEVADLVESARNSGKWHAAERVVVDAAINTGTAALSSATAAFTSADVGKSVAILGAGTAGALHNVLISAYTDSSHVTVSANAGTTVSGATCAIGNYSADGTHPSGSGAIAASAALNPATLLGSQAA